MVSGFVSAHLSVPIKVGKGGEGGRRERRKGKEEGKGGRRERRKKGKEEGIKRRLREEMG